MQSVQLTSRGGMAFAFFGGAMAWTAHLIGSYLIAEFACLLQLDEARFLGITWIAWSLLALSLFLLVVAVAAALTGWRAKRRLQAVASTDDEHADNMIHIARSGAIMSGLFVIVIIAQIIPIFYFLGSC